MSTPPSSRPLAVVGIDESSDRVYRHVLRHPGCTVRDICDRTSAPLAHVQTDLDVLLGRRLIRAVGDGYTAEAPELALGRLLEAESRRLGQLEEALVAAEAEVRSYANEHVAGQRPGRRPVSVDVVDPADFLEVLVAFVTHGSGEMRALRPDQWFLPSGHRMDVAVAEALATGRTSRAIYPAQIMDGFPDSVRTRVTAGEKVKVMPKVPTRMLIFGDEAAILPQRWATTDGVRLLVREPSLVALCIQYFEQLWRQAATVALGDAIEPDSPHRQLLQMLATGAKDEQIARTTGMSLRTVRRRIATILAELGVESRFQAGMEAVRRGLL